MNVAFQCVVFLSWQLIRVAAHSIHEDLNITSILKNRRQEPLPQLPQLPENIEDTIGHEQELPPPPNPFETPGHMYNGLTPRPDKPPELTRPDQAPEHAERPPPRSDVGHVNEVVKAAARRFTTPKTTTRKFVRSTPRRVSFREDCDYLAQYCLKAYDTSAVCGRTIYYKYYTFKNYCILDYVNCMERYEVWQVVHMGECFKVKELTEYILYPYDDDFFLDQYYIIEDN